MPKVKKKSNKCSSNFAQSK